MKKLNNLFITFEGIDGSGKTTIICLLTEAISKKSKIKILTTKEPGTTKIGQEIRNIILNNDMNKKTELMLFLADRENHLDTVIKPALKDDEIVLCDRYSDSTIAYQSNNDKDFSEISVMNNTITNFEPHLTFFLDIPVEESIRRIESRGNENRLDKLSKSEKIKIRNNYLKLARLYPERIKIINGNRKESDILADILVEIHKNIPEIKLF